MGPLGALSLYTRMHTHQRHHVLIRVQREWRGRLPAEVQATSPACCGLTGGELESPTFPLPRRPGFGRSNPQPGQPGAHLRNGNTLPSELPGHVV